MAWCFKLCNQCQGTRHRCKSQSDLEGVMTVQKWWCTQRSTYSPGADICPCFSSNALLYLKPGFTKLREKAETFRKIEKRETISRVNEKFISMGAVSHLPHHTHLASRGYSVNYVRLIPDDELFALFAYSFLGDMQWHRIAGYFPLPRLLPSEKKKQFLFFFFFF